MLFGAFAVAGIGCDAVLDVASHELAPRREPWVDKQRLVHGIFFEWLVFRIP
jgi:hypothetical protein